MWVMPRPTASPRTASAPPQAARPDLRQWVTLVLAALGSDGSHQLGTGCAGVPRSMRYSELARLLAGVSQKMLTQTLRSLERDGLITRTVTPTVPVTVEYELTDLPCHFTR
jgi:DNA-binding HxlR family transcriptional regulator